MAVAYKEISDPDKEKTQLRRLVNRVLKERRLSLVVGSDVELGDDSTEQPAVWIWLLIDPRSKLTKSELGHINELARAIKTEIFETNVRRQPYVRLRTAA